MAIINVVKYDGDDKTFAWKFPSENLRLGTQLVVKTSQYAFFVKSGKILDGFKEGTYTLKSGNLPILHKIIDIPFGNKSPFQAEVWFLNMISKLDHKWGTPTPIQLEDPKYNIVVPTRAFGQFGMSIKDPKKFLQTFVGNMRDFSTEKVVEYFKGKIISSVTSAIGEKLVLDGISILQLPLFLNDLSIYCKDKIKDVFEEYGIELENFYIISINVPESDPSIIKLKSTKDLAAKAKIAGKDLYQMDRSFDVMEKAAENEGSLGNIAGAGIGLGVGLGIGNQMGNLTKNMDFNQKRDAQPPPLFNKTIQYHVVINDQQSGPYSIEQIKLLIKKGMISKESLVWKEGMADWGNIKEQEELDILFNTTVPPPVPKK